MYCLKSIFFPSYCRHSWVFCPKWILNEIDKVLETSVGFYSMPFHCFGGISCCSSTSFCTFEKLFCLWMSSLEVSIQRLVVCSQINMVSNNSSVFFQISVGKQVLTFRHGHPGAVPRAPLELKKHQPSGRSLWSSCWSSWVQDAGVCWASRAGVSGPSGRVRQPCPSQSPLARVGCELDCPYLAWTLDSLCQLQCDMEETYKEL